MRDYMPEDQQERYGGEPMFGFDMQLFKYILGIVLIAAGGVLAIWICTTIFGVFNEPQKIEIFNQIIPPDPEAREISIEGKELVVPSGVFRFMAYFIGVFLLAVAARIAIGLISAGGNLLQPNIQKLQMKIDTHFKMLEMKMMSGLRSLEHTANEGTGSLGEKIAELLERLR